MTATNPYRLSSTLLGHSQDVRSVAIIPPSVHHPSSIILSASRDGTVRHWSDGIEIANSQAHSPKFVNAIAHVPPTIQHPQGLVLSAGADLLVYGHPVETAQSIEPVVSLVGHEDNICALDVWFPSQNQSSSSRSALNETQIFVVSGSWDKTARLWLDWQCIATLSGHAHAVWAVLFVPDKSNPSAPLVVTGSADKLIKIWQKGQCIRTLTGHTDCVRALSHAKLSYLIVSAGNDASIRLWNLSGQCLQQLDGHLSFIYSVKTCVNEQGEEEIISCGEDRTVRVWKDGSLIQTLAYPAVSVWCLAVCPITRDLIVGASDSAVRVFTRSSERVANVDALESFDQLVASQALPASQVGDVNKEKLPGPEALLQSGKKEGQVLMIRRGQVVEAHQWNATSQEWIKVGDVVDAVGSSRKQLYQGKEYDYVFDIDVGEGVPHLKLPFNVNENPYMAAQKFIDDNELSQNYLDEIAQFIMKNTQGASLSSGATQQEFVDPFTGHSRYSGNPSTSAPPQPTIKSSRLLPLKDFTYFDSGNAAGIFKKLEQFNNETSLLSEAEWQSLQTLLPLLEKPELFATQYKANIHTPLIQKCLLLPQEQRFPVLDLWRLCIYHASSLSLLGVDALPLFYECFEQAKAAQSSSNEINIMLSARCLVNVFRHSSCHALLSDEWLKMYEWTSSLVPLSANKNVALAIATLLQKYATCEALFYV